MAYGMMKEQSGRSVSPKKIYYKMSPQRISTTHKIVYVGLHTFKLLLNHEKKYCTFFPLQQ